MSYKNHNCLELIKPESCYSVIVNFTGVTRSLCANPFPSFPLQIWLNSFYFAKTLNVVFGVSYPVGKTNRLTVEPFLKYPLSGLGDEGIRFGAGRINLKIDFQSSKK